MAYGQYNQDFYQSNLTLETGDNQEQQLPPQQYVAAAQQQQWGQGGYPYVGTTATYPAGRLGKMSAQICELPFCIDFVHISELPFPIYPFLCEASVIVNSARRLLGM